MGLAYCSFIITITLAIVMVVDAIPSKDTGKCLFKDYGAGHELKAVERIRPLFGKKYVSHDMEGHWIFTVGICAELETPNAAVLQTELKKDGSKNVSFIVGSLTNVHIMAGGDWVYLEYNAGGSYDHHCNSEERRAVILISCDETVSNNDARMVFLEEEKEKVSSCYYLFEMKHKAVCPVSSSTSTLSIGSILVIVFFSVMAVYLLVGFLYQRFVVGSKGLEQIPNYELWKDLGNLQADGCDLFCRSKGRQNTGFRGIGDEQLDPADELRDDTLLPM